MTHCFNSYFQNSYMKAIKAKCDSKYKRYNIFILFFTIDDFQKKDIKIYQIACHLFLFNEIIVEYFSFLLTLFIFLPTYEIFVNKMYVK